VHHDKKRVSDFSRWFYARPHARNDSGVTWTFFADDIMQPGTGLTDLGSILSLPGVWTGETALLDALNVRSE
jgi:hypothetical protein